MKKRNIKNLQLNKKAISNLSTSHLTGGGSNTNAGCQTLDVDLCDTDLNSCYWLVCPFSDAAETICHSGNQ
ncbi:MAG: hypothetical protein AAF611_18500 [Bacteroidota bacterium]